MIDEVKLAFKELAENLLANKKVSLNNKHKLGFTIISFILFKEHIIKKSEVNNCSKIIFDYNKNEKYLNPINELSRFVENNTIEIADKGNIELIGTNDETIKDDIWAVHLIRNAFAHMEFTIENDVFKIHNTVNEQSTLVCDIPIHLIENFNSECLKIFCDNLETDYPNDITNIFFNPNFNDNKLLYMALYTYMVLCFDDKDIDVVNIKSVYMQPNFTSQNHQFNSDKEAVTNCINDCDQFQFDLNRLYEYLNPHHYESKSQKENRVRNKLIEKINTKYLQNVRSIRNSIKHANFVINDDGTISLFDMNDQNDLESKTYEITSSPESLFALARDIDENNISNDEFAFLNDIFYDADSDFEEKLNIIEAYFIELLENDYYIFVVGAEFPNRQCGIIEKILDIIACLKNRIDTSLNTKEMIVYLINYLEQLVKVSEELYNQFDNICFNVSYCEEIDVEKFRQFLIDLYLARMLTIELLMTQDNALTIIDNHTLVSSDYDHVKKLMK